MKALIHWKTKDGKETGQHGEAIPKPAADIAVIVLNNQHPERVFWVVPILEEVK